MIIFDTMTKNYALKLVCLVLVSAIMASPVMGAVCTMSCGDTRSCCCASDPGSGEAAYSAPDCCEGELQPSGDAAVFSDRHYSSFSSGQFTAAAVLQVDSIDEFSSGETGMPVSLAYLRPPPSPLFILNASFLI